MRQLQPNARVCEREHRKIDASNCILNEVQEVGDKKPPTITKLKYFPQPVQIGVSQGRSSVFATAQTNQTSPTFREFLVTLASDYSLATLDNQTLLSANSDKKAFVQAADVQIQGAVRSIKNSLASAIFRSGTGTIGRMTSITTGVIVLTSPNDVVQFEVGMVLQASATDGGAVRVALGYVIAVNRAAGTVTVSATLGGAAGTPSLWVANDFLLVQGDSNAKIKGLDAWLPFTTPTSTAFFGVDRTVDSVRLAGTRYDGSAQTIEEGLQDFLTQIVINDGMPDTIVTNPASYSALQKSLGSKVQYIDLQASAQIGFKAMQLQTSGLTLNIFADRNCPAQTAYALEMSSWQLISLGQAPQILTYGKEGLEVLRVYNQDAAELRVGYYANLVCSAPSHNGVIKLSA